MPVEIRCLKGRSYSLNQPFNISERLLGIISGIGPQHARRATELLQFHKVSGIISWGIATGLGTVNPGDLVLPETVIGQNGRTFTTDVAWRKQLQDLLQKTPIKIHNGPLAESRLMLETTRQKQALHNETGAIAADMESATIARVAEQNHLPCLVVRTVADPHDQDLPYAITRHTDMYGTPDTTRIFLEMLRNPRLLSRAMQLGRATNRALSTLKTVARQGNSALVTYG